MEESRRNKIRLVQLILFIVTFIFTTFAGAEWMFGKSVVYGPARLTISEVLAGLYYSVPFLGILTAHEFGHYLTAKRYKVDVSLPFYIPFWLGFVPFFSFGTMGAFIRIKSLIQSRKEYFDIGIAGPLAGFVVTLVVLTYGFLTLPEPEYIFQIHPEYEEYGLDYQEYAYGEQPVAVALGDNLLFMFFENFVADPEKVPNKYEMYHYPWIFAGYLALFFTALNLIPIGQLDGGHVIYGLFGYKNSRIISRALFLVMVGISGIGLLPVGPLDIDFLFNAILYFLFLFLSFHHFERDLRKRLLWITWIMILQIIAQHFVPQVGNYGIYMIFSFLLGRFLGINHPKAVEDEPLDMKRKIVGWIGLAVFIISFTPRPLYFEINEKAQIDRPGLEEKDSDPSKIITRRMVEVF